MSSKEEFVNGNIFKYKCLICDDVFETHNSNIQTVFCPYHKTVASQKELNVFHWLQSLGLHCNRSDRTQISPLELDIYIPEHKLAIEFDGLYWHSELFKDKNYHLNKTKMCEEKDIQLIHIFESEWDNKQPIVKSVIKSKLGLYDRKIYARKCEVKELSNEDYTNFLELNHLQGYATARYKLGLFFEGELVQLCSFGVSRFKKGETELIRSCSLLNTQVIGGFDKLVQYFMKTYESGSLVSYVDRRYFNGKGYKNWELIEETKPNYWYWKFGNTYVENRINYQKHKLPKLLENFDINKTEVENMYDNRIQQNLRLPEI